MPTTTTRQSRQGERDALVTLYAMLLAGPFGLAGAIGYFAFRTLWDPGDTRCDPRWKRCA